MSHLGSVLPFQELVWEQCAFAVLWCVLLACASRFTNNVLSTAQTVYLRQMGGATPVVTAESAAEIIDVGQAKRTASPANVATEQDTDAARGER